MAGEVITRGGLAANQNRRESNGDTRAAHLPGHEPLGLHLRRRRAGTSCRLVADALAEVEGLRRLALTLELPAEIEAEQEALRHLLDLIEERAFASA